MGPNYGGPTFSDGVQDMIPTLSGAPSQVMRPWLAGDAGPSGPWLRAMRRKWGGSRAGREAAGRLAAFASARAPGDRISAFASGTDSFADGRGVAGYAILRGGRVVAAMALDVQSSAPSPCQK